MTTKTGPQTFADRCVEMWLVVYVVVSEVVRAGGGQIGIGYDGTHMFIYWEVRRNDEDQDED